MKEPFLKTLAETKLETLPSFLRENKRLLFFGGKGGVGKTTASASTAILLSDLYRDKKILYLSLDPAHSISDSLVRDLSRTPTQIFPNLWGQEVDSSFLYKEFIENNKKYLKTLASRGTFFDDSDIESFFELSIPGIDEVMGVFYLARLLEENQYDTLIVDTAPTGHTIRLLSLPNVMQRWVSIFDLMQQKHRYLKSQFSGHYEVDESDQFLEETRARLEFFERALTDKSQTEFVPVTIAEPMALLETERLLDKLQSDHIPVNNIIINRLIPRNSCGYCARRKGVQIENLRTYESQWSEFRSLRIPLFANEVRGLDSIYKFSEKILSPEQEDRSLASVEKFEWRSPSPQIQVSRLCDKKTKFLIFSGKGGVGKTTVASAVAVFFAQRFPDKKVFIFSTDPAHSLSDSFCQVVGETAHQIGHFPNLCGEELNAEKLLKEFKDDYRSEIEELFENFLGPNLDLKFDREVVEGLIDLCPPGVDELMALNQILRLVEENHYDFFILDSAPTGHLVRLLETPDVVRGWLKGVFELLIKYRGVTRLGEIAKKLIKLSRDVRHVKELLTNRQKTKVVVVTIPEAMGVLETEDLLRSYRVLGMNPTYLVVNSVVPSLACDLCRVKSAEQRGYIKKIKKISPPGCFIGEIPQFPGPVQGKTLEELSQSIFY